MLLSGYEIKTDTLTALRQSPVLCRRVIFCKRSQATDAIISLMTLVMNWTLQINKNWIY